MSYSHTRVFTSPNLATLRSSSGHRSSAPIPASTPLHQNNHSLHCHPAAFVGTRDLQSPASLRRWVQCAATSRGDDNLGGFFSSDIVQKDISSIMSSWMELNRLMPKFADFDVEGKRLFLDNMDTTIERLRIFNARAKLSDDAMVKQALGMLNVQLLNMSTNLESLYNAATEQNQVLREIMEAEAKISNPEELKWFRERLKQQSVGEAAMNERMRRMNENVLKFPEAMMVMTQNPKALSALEKAAKDGEEGIRQYKENDPELYNAMCKLFEF